MGIEPGKQINRSGGVLLPNRPSRAEIGGYVAGGMVMTPWGNANGLRERRLAPGRGTPRAEVERNQRERLFAAMVAVTAERGYPETSVSDLVELSGVSSRSFYDLFAGKEDCFLATMDGILLAVQKLASEELGGEGTMEARALRAAQTLAKTAVAQPATARLWIVEAFCAGEEARRRIDTAQARLTEQLQAVLCELPARPEMPPELTRAILGGIAGVLYRRLARGEEETIPSLTRGLNEWALGLPPPPGPLRPKGRRNRARGEGSPPFVAHVPGERVLRGFVAAVAEKGYAATTIADIAAAASISQNTFYAHFRNKEDALYAAIDSSGAQMVAATLPAVRRAPEWPGAVRVALEALCGFLTAEPAFAHLREIEVYAIGPQAVEHRDRAGKEIVEVLGALALESPAAPNPLVVEVTLTAIQSLFYERMRSTGPSGLTELVPLATYLALAPLIGAKDAFAAASG